MTPQSIKVTPSPAKDGIQWQLCHKAPSKPEVCGTEPNYPPVVLNPNSGAHVFTVTINDPHKMGIKFSSDPLWIQADTKPTQPVIDQTQITNVTPGATKLVFVDRNKDDPVLLVYQLNFVGPDQQPVKAIDPDIRNGGSDFIGDYGAALLAGIALLVLLGAIWLGVKAIRSRAAPSGTAGDTGTSASGQQGDVNRDSGDRE